MEKYELEAAAKCSSLIDTGANRTVGENLDRKIAALKEEIARLEASKTTLSPLLHMTLRDLREAMTY